MAQPNYTIISADCHAGGSHEQYREYLDPEWRDEFDAWRGQYKNPWKDLRDTDLRIRNWDDDRRDADQLSDGVVAEVVYPNTVPPFYPGFVLFAGPPTAEDYAKRRAGIHAHNRWMVDFCARQPERRAGIGQFFLNNIDDALADIRWIAEQGLRGGVLLPSVAPDVKWIKPLYDPCYDPIWAACQDLDLVVNLHSGTGSPDYGRYAVTPMLMISEVAFYGQRAFAHLLLSGVFERFPKLKFAMTEGSAAGIVALVDQLDPVIKRVNSGEIGELKYTQENGLPKLASEYFAQNCWIGASFPNVPDVETRKRLGPDRFMWGSDYPHDEGTPPFTREHLRQVFPGVGVTEMRRILGENAAKLYKFDLDALAPLAAQYGPTVEELSEPLTRLPEGANEALLRADEYLRKSA
ncbi:MAG: amidohydrolase [Acidimicrobiia bacterium]|nr:amidohydrolase [Acidimicrobiia bacterium]